MSMTLFPVKDLLIQSVIGNHTFVLGGEFNKKSGIKTGIS